MKIDISYLKEHAPSLCSPVLCTELGDNQKVRLLKEGEIKAGEPLFAVDVYEHSIDCGKCYCPHQSPTEK